MTIRTSRCPFLSDVRQCFWLWLILIAFFSVFLLLLPALFGGDVEPLTMIWIGCMALIPHVAVLLPSLVLGLAREHTFVLDGAENQITKDGDRLTRLSAIQRVKITTALFGCHRGLRLNLVLSSGRQVIILQTRMLGDAWKERNACWDIMGEPDYFAPPWRLWSWTEYKGQKYGFSVEDATIFQVAEKISAFIVQFAPAREYADWHF